MHSSKLAIKLFIKSPADVDMRAFVPLFHEWIQTRAIADHTLIDVADYHHVEQGPGTVLVAHEANYSTDQSGGRLGLAYVRKQPIEGNFTVRLKQVLRATLLAALLLEKAPAFAGKLTFRTDEIQLRIHDRLHAPNTAESFAALRPVIESVFAQLTGGPVQLSHHVDPELLFEVTVKTPFQGSASDLYARVS